MLGSSLTMAGTKEVRGARFGGLFRVFAFGVEEVFDLPGGNRGTPPPHLSIKEVFTTFSTILFFC